MSATAASGPPDGMIEVFEGVASVATATLSSGTASFSRTDLLPGTHSFAARYLGNEFFAGQTSDGIAHVVTSPNVVVTSTGTGVVSEPIATLPDGTQAPVAIEFGTVTEAGSTTVTAIRPGRRRQTGSSYSAGSNRFTTMWRQLRRSLGRREFALRGLRANLPTRTTPDCFTMSTVHG